MFVEELGSTCVVKWWRSGQPTGVFVIVWYIVMELLSSVAVAAMT